MHACMAKRGHMIRTWKTRYFVQQQSHLRYYERESTAPPFGLGFKGELRLAGAVMVATEFHAAKRLSAALRGTDCTNVYEGIH